MAAVLAVVALALTGCTAAPAPVSSSSPPAVATSPGVSSSPTAQPARSKADPTASAEDNLEVFRRVITGVWAGGDRASGRAYIDALVAAGFDKSRMELTPDTSTVGNPAESIQFSVRWDQECIIGQVGPATGDPFATVVPVLAEGRCLVGDTRPIDW